MCAGACLQTHIGRIVFGAWDAKLGACGSVWDIPRDPHVGLVPEVIGGVREAECGRLMTDSSRADANYFPKETNTQGDGKKSGMQYHQSVIPTKNRKKRMLQ